MFLTGEWIAPYSSLSRTADRRGRFGVAETAHTYAAATLTASLLLFRSRPYMPLSSIARLDCASAAHFLTAFLTAAVTVITGQQDLLAMLGGLGAHLKRVTEAARREAATIRRQRVWRIVSRPHITDADQQILRALNALPPDVQTQLRQLIQTAARIHTARPLPSRSGRALRVVSAAGGGAVSSRAR